MYLNISFSTYDTELLTSNHIYNCLTSINEINIEREGEREKCMSNKMFYFIFI